MDRSAFYAELRKRGSGLFGTSLSQSQVDGIEAILDEADHRQTPFRHLAYMLATAYLEVDRTMQPITERGQRSYFDKYEPGTKIGKTLGNTMKGDGFLYRGRGLVQLTGRTNYARASRELKVDFLLQPEMALITKNAVAIMFAGMTEGWFTGKKLSDYLNGSKPDYVEARRIINGQDKAEKIAGYAADFAFALNEASYGFMAPQKPAIDPTASPEATVVAQVDIPPKTDLIASKVPGKDEAVVVAVPHAEVKKADQNATWIGLAVAGGFATVAAGWHHIHDFVVGLFLMSLFNSNALHNAINVLTVVVTSGGPDRVRLDCVRRQRQRCVAHRSGHCLSRSSS